MKKSFLYCLVLLATALSFAGCGGSSRMTKATSTRTELAASVRYTPSIANVEVNPKHVYAYCSARDLESLNEEQAKQTVVAKALAKVNGDFMIAPSFKRVNNLSGKLDTLYVTGYAATITSIRPLTTRDIRPDSASNNSNVSTRDKLALNTMTIADIEYGPKKTLTLSAGDLIGKNEQTALEYARKQMLREEKMDLLYGEQYKVTVNNGSISSLTLSAYPGKYVNYRTTNADEMAALKPGTEPIVYYNTIVADVKPLRKRIQAKIDNDNTAATEANLKAATRASILEMFDADMLLNEHFIVDYREKIISQITICGTPAAYTNFRPLKADDLVDLKLVPNASLGGEEKPKGGLFDSLLKVFKKKK